ncbi:MAG: Wzz/FepE/Etk N-terminal domain-containing protein [Acutalibacteraceae bacterium]|nr:Wzz/FepE/Etk N-terminal domain-containing protein [Acutalibacteraceae bacterium]
MNELTVSNIFSIILRRIWLVVIVAVLCGAVAFGYCSFLATPVYRANTSILITNGGIITDSTNDSIQTNDLSASIYLVDTCVDILKSQKIYKDLSEAIDGKYSHSQLKGGFSISRRDEESLFIDISFKSTSASEAKLIVNAFTELSPSYTEEVLPSVTVEILDMSDSASCVYPQTLSTSVVFAMLGAVATCVLLILIATLDQTIKNEDDFISHFDIPVLGTVPDFDNSPTYAYKAKTGNVSTGGV